MDDVRICMNESDAVISANVSDPLVRMWLPVKLYSYQPPDRKVLHHNAVNCRTGDRVATRR